MNEKKFRPSAVAAAVGGMSNEEARKRGELLFEMISFVPDNGPNYRKRVASLMAKPIALPILEDLARLLRDVRKAEDERAKLLRFYRASRDLVLTLTSENSALHGDAAQAEFEAAQKDVADLNV